jgi:penicillin-binding protein 1C
MAGAALKNSALGGPARLWLAVAVLAAGAAHAVPSFGDVRSAHQPSDLPLLARDGSVLQMLRVDMQVRRAPWVSLADVSPALRTALVLGEDRRFWAHSGVDWPALAASAWANAWNQHTRGASTLTMQLAGLLDDTLQRPAGGRSVGQKIGQIAQARALEAQWSKAQILEAYLNRVPLRGELVGVAAASQVLLGKQPSGLDAQEAAFLAAMVRAPNATAGALERRACEVLRQQNQPCDGLATLVTQALARRPGPLHSAQGQTQAPHFAQWLWHTQGSRALTRSAANGPALQSTLDAPTQRLANSVLRRQLAELRGREVEDGAVLVLDNRSGEVLAWVGSSGPLSGAAEVDAVLAQRQPGSTVKPFVYALALQQRLITPASLLDDSPLQVASSGALYQPQNYDHRHLGFITARQALAASVNVPAVRVGMMLGPDALFAGLNAAGLQLRHSAGWHGQALALGTADVSLLALTNAYRMLANGGVIGPVQGAAQPGTAAAAARQASAAPQRVLSAAAAFQVADMLADASARASTFGMDSPLVTRGWAAVKTGTSKDMRDNWCIGFSDRYTVGVWVGNASGVPMHGVSGVSGAAPVWRELMAHLHQHQVSRAPAAPAGLLRRADEWFVQGTEPVAAALVPAQPGVLATPATGVRSPRDGMVLVLDPDIPMAAQRLSLQGAPGTWVLNGRVLGQGSQLSWLPRPGRHLLQWRGEEPGATQQVRFEVRAALQPSATLAKLPNPATQPSRGAQQP